MKVKCNVCKDSPTVEVAEQPCGYSRKLTWQFLDTNFNNDFGGFPVTFY